MTPKEKAQDLFDKYFLLNYDWDGVTKTQWAKEGALIAVDELIESHLNLTTTHETEPSIRCKTYWQEVKQEIEKL